MGKGKRHKRNKANARRRSKQLPSGTGSGPTTSVNDLPDELLDAVLLNLGSSPDQLIRAAATCKRWRRAIAGAGFLARCRALHGAPPVAGRYHVTGSRLTPRPNATTTARWARPPLPAAEKPAAAFVPSSPAAAAVVDARHFSLDFLYVPPVDDDGDRRPRNTYYYNCRSRARHGRCREIVDSRGSLLLLTSGPWWESVDPRRWSPDFIVCEPVSQRYQGIARPADLSHLPLLGAFLLDGAGAGAAGDAMSNYRVLSVIYERSRSRYPLCTPRACVFTPGSDGGWRICWDDDDTAMDDPDDGGEEVEVPDMETIHFAGRCAGKVCWGTESSSVLFLDEGTLKFSLLTFPAPVQWPYRSRRTSFRVVGGNGGGKVRVVRVDGDALEVFGQLLDDSGEWVMERSISLRDATATLPGWEYRLFRLPASVVTADDRFVVLTPGEKTWLFSVDLDTMEVEKRHGRDRRHVGPSYSYPCALPWPPVLRACVHHGDNATGKKRHTRQRRSCT